MPIRFALLTAALLLVSCNSTVNRPAAVSDDANSTVAAETTTAAVEPQAEAPPCDGKMCYSISENKITIYNTPGETSTMTTDLDMPPDVRSMKRQLMVYDIDGKTDLGPIDIQIDRTGVRSVSMKGKPIPKKD